jgi:hypothetical protein
MDTNFKLSLWYHSKDTNANGDGLADRLRQKILEWLGEDDSGSLSTESRFSEWMVDGSEPIPIVKGRVLLSLFDAPAPGRLSATGREELDRALNELNLAVSGMRDNGRLDLRPRALLTRAHAWRLREDWANAQTDLDEVLGITAKNHMRLYLTEAQLFKVQLLLDRASAGQGEKKHLTENARQALTEARALVAEIGYHSRLPELDLLELRLAFVSGEEQPDTAILDQFVERQ